MFDDAARMANGALGTLASLRREAEAQARQQLERLIAQLDLVTRDEFEAVKAMAAKARAEQEALAKRLDALEKAAMKTPKPRKPRTPKAG
jgi:BMFP domain-containing protein YqiC